MAADQALAAALKQAKGKKMFFAFLLKGGDGKLLVSKAKVKPKEIADAKKETGGTPITGRCFMEGSSMVFEVVKDPPGTFGAAIKKVAHRDAGMTIVPAVRLAGDADADEGDGDEAAPQAAAPASAAPSPPSRDQTQAPPQVDAKDGADADGALDLGPWQAARQNAVTGLKALAAKVAATKHGSAAGVLKEIQGIIAKLPANLTPKDVDKVAAFVTSDESISAVEEVPDEFHNFDIRKPLLDALQALKK